MAAYVDPVARSIRIATTLTERLGVIFKQSAQSQHSAEFDATIGEAQQLYPEIWRHLDEARAQLARRGIDVAAYDEIRATEHPGQQALEDVQTATGVNPFLLPFGTLEVATFKTVTFNGAGHAKAVRACTALMHAMPQVDWEELARAEDEEIAAAGKLRSNTWRYVGVGLAIAFVIWLLNAS